MTAKASKKAAETKKPAKNDKPAKLDKTHAKAPEVKAAKSGKSGKSGKSEADPKTAAAPAAPTKVAHKPTAPGRYEARDEDQEVEREGGLKKKELKRFREILHEKREEILRNAKRTLSEDMTLDSDDLADEMDLASSEYLQSFTLRLRGREKTFLKKIDHALTKIDDGSFGMCEDCGELISIKRLEARPETTLCIRCKEDQERMEKAYG